MILPPAQPTQGTNCNGDVHIRIPHPPNPWILRCGMGPPHSPRCKQARDGPTLVRPLHFLGLWSNQQRHCHAENSRLGTLVERRVKACITIMHRIVHVHVDILVSDHTYRHLQAEGPTMPSSTYHTRGLWHTSADSSAPCKYPLLYIYAPVPCSRHIQPHAHSTRYPWRVLYYTGRSIRKHCVNVYRW